MEATRNPESDVPQPPRETEESAHIRRLGEVGKAEGKNSFLQKEGCHATPGEQKSAGEKERNETD